MNVLEALNIWGQVHYPLQMHFNLASEEREGEPDIESPRLTASTDLTKSIELSQHLCASFVFVVNRIGETDHRITTTFHPITGRLSVGMTDLQGWVAAMGGCAVTQQVLFTCSDFEVLWSCES